MAQVETEDRIIKKIADALALAERGVGGEAENAMALFQRLSTRHSIDLQTIKEYQEGKTAPQKPIRKQFAVGERGNRGAGAYVELFKVIARENYLQFVWDVGGSWIELVGYSSDIKTTQDLYEVAVVQMIQGCEEYLDDRESEWRAQGYDKREARRSFYFGFIDRIEGRLHEARMDAEREARDDYASQGVSTDLVIRDKRKKVAALYQDLVADTNAGWARGPNRGRGGAARTAGRRAGDSARLFGSSGDLANRRGLSR